MVFLVHINKAHSKALKTIKKTSYDLEDNQEGRSWSETLQRRLKFLQIFKEHFKSSSNFQSFFKEC